MKRTFTFIKREIVEYEIEVEAADLDSATRAFEKEIEDGSYAAGGSDVTDSETLVCCEVCGEKLEINDAFNCRINIDSEDERVVCDECVCDLQNEGKLIFCRNCYELYVPESLLADPQTGKRSVCPHCGKNAYKEG